MTLISNGAPAVNCHELCLIQRPAVEDVSATYATHLNAANPFTRTRIHEPGRAFYAGVEYGF